MIYDISSLKPDLSLGQYFAIMIGALVGLKLLSYIALIYQEYEDTIYSYFDSYFTKRTSEKEEIEIENINDFQDIEL